MLEPLVQVKMLKNSSLGYSVNQEIKTWLERITNADKE